MCEVADDSTMVRAKDEGISYHIPHNRERGDAYQRLDEDREGVLGLQRQLCQVRSATSHG